MTHSVVLQCTLIQYEGYRDGDRCQHMGPYGPGRDLDFWIHVFDSVIVD